MPLGNTWRGTLRKTSPKPWIEYVPNWESRLTILYRRPLAAFKSEANGNSRALNWNCFSPALMLYLEGSARR